MAAPLLVEDRGCQVNNGRSCGLHRLVQPLHTGYKLPKANGIEW